jgi:predicted dehydrogenase
MKSAQKKILTGLTSYGLSGKAFHGPFIKAHEGFQLKKVLERHAKKCYLDFPEVESVDKFEDIINDPEIELVIVNSPDHTHFELAKTALEAGKHVIVEKPFTLNSKDGQSLIETAAKSNRMLSVYHNRRYDGDFQTVKQIIKQNMLGKLVEFESHFDRYRKDAKDNWKNDPKIGSTILFDLGSHMIDQALVLFGLPQSVTADLRIQRKSSRVDDFYDIRMNYGDLTVKLHGGYLVRELGPRYILHGTEGSFIKYGIDSQEEALVKEKLPNEAGFGLESEKFWGILNTEINNLHYTGRIETLPGNYSRYYDNIYSVIRENGAPDVSAEEALNVIKVIEAAKESSRTQTTIKM